MDNPNPIKYSDLIAPDNSITTLIEQLTALIAKYDEAKTKIQGAAADAAKSMQNLSGATEEQRQQIASLTTETDKLVAEYKKSNDAESETFRRRQQVISAVKEQQRIDKLIVEINNSKEGSYKRLSAQYRLNKIRLNEMSLAEREGTEAGRKLETETRVMYEEMSRLQKATGKYTLEVGHYENALRGLPGPINQVVSGISNMRGQLHTIGSSSLPLAAKAAQGFTTVLSGTIGLVMIFVRQLTGSAKTLREFEQANANLSTILGTTRDEMNALTESALMLGRTTEYTASQVTSLQTELAKLGFGQGSIMAMQKAVLQFATAVGANLADAASVAGSTLRAFNLTSADTENVLATLAVATNKSALSFERIQQSIGTVFPVANAFGLSVKDATALLGALANAGFDASAAATATRNILLNLANANGKLAKAMGGPAKTFDEIIDGLIKLRKAGTDLNQALELTSQRSVAAFAAFMSGAESARELRAELEDVSGELDRIQSERLNTVEGSTKLLKSAWEGLTLAFQNSNGTIKSTIDWLAKLVSETQKLLFPTATMQSEAAQKLTKDLQDYYAQNGAAAAEAYIKWFVKKAQDEAKAAERTASEEGGLLNRLFGIGKHEIKADVAKNIAIAAEQAGNVVLAQIANDRKEADAQAARDAELAAQEAQQKADELTKEEKKRIEAEKKQRIADRKAVIESINLEISITEAGTDKMLQLRLDKVEAERQLELEINRQKAKTERQDEAAINAKYDKARIDAEKQFNADVSKLAINRLQSEQQAIQLEIAITEDGTQRMLELRLENLEKQRQIEIEQNKQKDVKIRQDEKAINAKYDALKLKETANFNHKLAQRDLAAAQDLAQAEFDLMDKNERQKTIFRLQQEKARLEAVLKLNETATEKMTETEIAAIKKTIEGIDKETERLGYDNIYEVLGLGLDSKQQDALNTAIDSVKDSISSLADSWQKAADAAVDAANKQVESAQSMLEAEIEARNAGYAHNVEMAQKELMLAKATQAEALREKEKAQKAQLRLDTITQSSSLVTATANIWASLSGITGIGPALAIAAITTMWGSFIAAKVKAAQVAGQTEQYGEGTVELLEGGSHASGHDIDLGTKRDGTRRRAEGGEYFAIINKRNSRRYRNVIPDVINSLNDGTFADRYQRANATMAGYAVNMIGGGTTDVTAIENDVAAIRKQGDETRYVDGHGNTVIHYKNLIRKIKS